MTFPSQRSVVSIFLAFNVMALAVAAIPDPGALRAADGQRDSGDDAISAEVRPVLDGGAGLLREMTTWAWQVTTVPRWVTSRYTTRLGLAQTWNMFANPPRGAEYLRLRYNVDKGQSNGGGLALGTELVFPVNPDSENPGIRAFWRAHQDKAVSNALSPYFAERTRRLAQGLPPPSDHDLELDIALARSLVPVVQYFSTRFARRQLLAGARVVSTEAWYGFAPSRPRGESSISPQSRATALDHYYHGPSVEPVPRLLSRPIDTVEREADIQWLLIYVR